MVIFVSSGGPTDELTGFMVLLCTYKPLTEGERQDAWRRGAFCLITLMIPLLGINRNLSSVLTH